MTDAIDTNTPSTTTPSTAPALTGQDNSSSVWRERTAVHVAGPTGTDVIGSAVTPFGSPVAPSQIGPDTLVRVGGMQTSAAVAEQLGYLVRNPNTGMYTAPTAAPAAPQQAAQQQAPQTTQQQAQVVPMDKQTQALVDNLNRDLSSSSSTRALREVVQTGEVSHNTLVNIASELGMEPGQAAELMERVHSGYTAQAAAVISKATGMDPSAVHDWAMANAPREMQQAMQAHVQMGDTSAYVALANRYAQSLADTDPDAVLNAEFGSGITAQRHPDGNILLNIPRYGQMTYKQAVKMNLIRIR